MAEMVDEYLDLVDENDQVIGRKLRSGVYAQNLSNFRVVNAFLVNSKGQLWIPRRGPHKRIFPLCLDMSMGGHVESGEDYDQAFQRELLEELSIDAKVTPFEVLGSLTPHEHQVSAFMKVYKIETDRTPQYNPDDFIESFWLAPDELLDKLEVDKSKDDLPKLVRYFFK